MSEAAVNAIYLNTIWEEINTNNNVNIKNKMDKNIKVSIKLNRRLIGYSSNKT